MPLQVWMSAYQVAHCLAVTEHILKTLPRMHAAPLPPPAAAVAAEVRTLLHSLLFHPW